MTLYNKDVTGNRAISVPSEWPVPKFVNAICNILIHNLWSWLRRTPDRQIYHYLWWTRGVIKISEHSRWKRTLFDWASNICTITLRAAVDGNYVLGVFSLSDDWLNKVWIKTPMWQVLQRHQPSDIYWVKKYWFSD